MLSVGRMGLDYDTVTNISCPPFPMKRAFFNTKRDKGRHNLPGAERLVLRNPTHNKGVQEALRKDGVEHVPKQITVGYYLKEVYEIDPRPFFYFIPSKSKAALAILTAEFVAVRIANDLIKKNRDWV